MFKNFSKTNFFQQNSTNRGFTRTPKKFGVTPKRGGFTLIETLVSIAIFTTSILSLLVVLSGGIANTNYAKRKIIASYLAQEGIEYIRNMRDTYVLYDSSGSTTAGWNAFNVKVAGSAGNSVCAQANGCYFDDQTLNYSNNTQPITNIPLITCGSTCPMLFYNDTLTSTSYGKYGYDSSGVSSGYIRKIRVIPISADETKILSTVSWSQGSGNYNIVFSESIFNWVQ